MKLKRGKIKDILSYLIVSFSTFTVAMIFMQNKAEFDERLPQLINTVSDRPILMEVFTDMDIDAECINTILSPYREEKMSLKQQIGKMMPTEMKKTIKRIIR